MSRAGSPEPNFLKGKKPRAIRQLQFDDAPEATKEQPQKQKQQSKQKAQPSQQKSNPQKQNPQQSKKQTQHPQKNDLLTELKKPNLLKALKVKDTKEFLAKVSDFMEEESKYRAGAKITPEQLGFFLHNYFVNKKLFGLGRDRIFAYVTKEYPEMKLTRRQVNRILQRFEILQLTAPKKKTTDVKKIITKKPMNIVEMDLLDFSNLAWKKDKWMMTAVDTHSKYLFAVPLKSKEEKEVSRAFRALLAQIKKETKMVPKNVLTDNGTEFLNTTIKGIYDKQDINHMVTKPGEASHAVNVERMNLYLRHKVTQWREPFDDMNWVKYLPTILKNYNKTPSRVIR